MRKVFLFFLCSTLGSAAVAMDPDECRKLSGVAKTIMEARQKGMPMADMMDVATAQGDTPFGNFTKSTTIAAYEEPRFGTPEMRSRAISEFENGIYLECIKN